MNLLYDSGDEGDKQVKTFESHGQLFKISLEAQPHPNYRIYRFSESGSWEILEAEGDSFIGNPDIRKRGYIYKGETTPANWYEWWDRLEQSVLDYAEVLKPYREVQIE